MQRRFIGLVGLGVLVSACAGPSVLISGESVRPPETPPPVLPLVVLAADDLTPLVADVRVDGEPLRTDVTGRAAVVWEEAWNDGTVAVEISVAGFHPAAMELDGVPDEAPLEVRLEPVVLQGRVVTNAGAPVDNAAVDLNGQSVQTDGDGEFRFQRATPGDLVATRPAWAETVASWDGRVSDVELTLEPRIEHGLRVNPAKADDPEEWARLLVLADTTDVSAFVLDIKDEGGTVHHATTVEAANEIGAVVPGYDVRAVLADMERHGLYKIARVSTFQDDPMARAEPDTAVRDAKTGGLWESKSGAAWLDPTDPAAWEYPLALAEEACVLGFDEIQFDGAAFPSGGSIATMDFDDEDFDFAGLEDYLAEENQKVRVATIAAFLAEARARLNPAGCAVAVNAQSITFHGNTSDEGVGLLPEPLSHVVDVISPTIYADSYPDGWNGYEDPNLFAPEIVRDVLNTGLARVEGLAIVRPWLQRVFLESADIMEEQDEATQRGLGWMLWSVSSSYDKSFLRPE